MNKNHNICDRCIHDCVVDDVNFNNCVNFQSGKRSFEWWNLLKTHNINIKKMCDNYGLKRNYLYKMLNGKIRMKYKYAKTILMCIEKRTYIPDQSMADFENGGETDRKKEKR